jgi:hypothetical protein
VRSEMELVAKGGRHHRCNTALPGLTSAASEDSTTSWPRLGAVDCASCCRSSITVLRAVALHSTIGGQPMLHDRAILPTSVPRQPSLAHMLPTGVLAVVDAHASTPTR